MIRWNWTPKKIVLVDFETQSRVDLRESGSWVYARSESTKLLSAVFKIPGKKPLVWIPRPCPGLKYPGAVTGEQVPRQVIDLVDSHTWVAHNAEGFDAIVWESLYPALTPAWLDTLPLAKASGLPGSIDALGKLLGFGGKEKAGQDALMMLSRIKSTKRPIVGTAPLWVKMLNYNVKDVEVLEAVYRRVEPSLRQHAKTLAVHSQINERGIKVDKAFAKKLFRLWDKAKGKAGDAVYELTGGKLSSLMLRSVPAVHNWLRSQGIALDTLRREEVDAVLADPSELGDVDDEKLSLVTEVLRQRSIATRTADAKILRLLDSIDESETLRYPFVYHGAATGRWSSRGVQIHNLPRGSGDTESLLRKPLAEPEVLNTLLRPVFVAEPGKHLGIIDFGAIEARCLAWMSGEKTLLKLFSDPKQDVYCDMASGLFGKPITKADKVERQVGKIIILGCGYSMGAVRFEAFCKVSKVDLEAVELTGKLCVDGYRKRYPDIPKLWKAVERAAMSACRGEKSIAGRCSFFRDQTDLVAELPSGRHIVYRNARVCKQVPIWARMLRKPVAPQDAIVYDHPHGYPKTLYGGLLVENLDQAISRDLLAVSLEKLVDRGFDVRLHVHDEAVYESDDETRLDEAARIMSTPPTWAKGFPLTVEGFTCPRYSKSPFKRSRHVKAINGKTY